MHVHQKKHFLSLGFFIASFLVAFAIFVEKLELRKLVGFDARIIRVVQERIDDPLSRFMKFFTFLGSPIMVSVFVVLSVMSLYRNGQKREAVGMLIANAVGAGFNEGLKYIFRRKRPDIHRLVPVHGYSFPSGHAMGSVMFYGTICYFICRKVSNAVLKLCVYAISGFMVMITGLSRIYLGVHYPSDVLAGYAASGAWLSAAIRGLNAVLGKGVKRYS